MLWRRATTAIRRVGRRTWVAAKAERCLGRSQLECGEYLGAGSAVGDETEASLELCDGCFDALPEVIVGDVVQESLRR